jgi:non-ribosomal peptide synthase protein (TIGR01720 family)
MMKPLLVLASQEKVEGSLPLSPIQYDFFGRKLKAPHHYNQFILLKNTEPFVVEYLQAVIDRLMTHHDALRSCFPLNETGIYQYNKGVELRSLLIEMDITESPDPLAVLKEKGHELQESFDLSNGPLFKAALFSMKDGDRLMLLAHHLVVDGISWRILLEDFHALYEQAKTGADLALPPKTESFRAWTTELQNLAMQHAFHSAQAFWLAHQPLPEHRIVTPGKAGLKKDIRFQSFTLEEAETNDLLNGIHHAYHTEINDILLAALSASLHRVFGNNNISIAMEGHGRGHPVNLDISRTVGWFTSIYPVLLNASHAGDWEKHIRHTKELLRQIPDKGAGYGILKWIKKEPALVHAETPQVIFNYLGQFDNNLPATGISFSGENAGPVYSGDERIEYPLAISGKVVNGKLQMVVESDPASIAEEKALSFTGTFEKCLVQIINHCSAQTETQVTLSDLQYKGLTEQTLNSLFD